MCSELFNFWYLEVVLYSTVHILYCPTVQNWNCMAVYDKSLGSKFTTLIADWKYGQFVCYTKSLIIPGAGHATMFSGPTNCCLLLDGCTRCNYSIYSFNMFRILLVAEALTRCRKVKKLSSSELVPITSDSLNMLVYD